MDRVMNYSLAVVVLLIGAGSLGCTKVTIVNTASEPVPMFDVDNPARHPFQETLVKILSPGEANGGSSLTVPAGKRLVIEYVSGEANATPGQGLWLSIITTIGGGADYREFNLVVHPSGISNVQIVSQPLRAFANPGTLVTGSIKRSDVTGQVLVSFTISGYLVDVP